MYVCVQTHMHMELEVDECLHQSHSTLFSEADLLPEPTSLARLAI